MKIQINHSYKEIPDGHQIFVMQPGTGKVFFDDFLKQSRVFLELIGIELDSPFELDPITRQKLFMGYENAKWILRDKPGKRPSQNLSDYSPKRGLASSGERPDTKIIYAANRLFNQAKPGDLVLVSGYGAVGKVLAGEIVGDFSRKTTARASIFENEHLPARRIKWLETDAIKLDFSPKFYKQFSSPNPLNLLDNTLRFEAYDYAYGDYILPSGSNIVLDIEPAGSTEQRIDPLAQRRAQDLILYFNALYNAIHAGKTAEFCQLNMEQAIQSGFYEMEILGAEYDLHSPGNITYRVRSMAKAGFVSAMLAITPHMADAAAPQDTKIEIVNSWNTEPSDCDVKVHESVEDALVHLGVREWQELCRINKESSENIKTETSAEVRVTENG